MIRSRAAIPLAAAVGLAACLLATVTLYRSAAGALDDVLEARLRAAGASATLLVRRSAASPDLMRDVMEANGLDGAYVIDASMAIVADARGATADEPNLLRVDAVRVRQALGGVETVGRDYALGELPMITGYFPVRDERGGISVVLGLEAGEPFAGARRDLVRSLATAVAISVAGAAALALGAAAYTRSESSRREAAARAARAEALSRVAAMAAHEIRNPLGIIRATVDLMRERSRGALSSRDENALGDVLGEVDRLHLLTQDLLDLASDRPVVSVEIDVTDVVGATVRAAQDSWPDLQVQSDVPPLPPVRGDPDRLRQVLSNLVTNAAEAVDGRGVVRVRADRRRGAIRILVSDEGPGVGPEARERLFEPFFTTKATGTGLGLALSRRIAERLGGTLCLVEDDGQGATFELVLPITS